MGLNNWCDKIPIEDLPRFVHRGQALFHGKLEAGDSSLHRFPYHAVAAGQGAACNNAGPEQTGVKGFISHKGTSN